MPRLDLTQDTLEWLQYRQSHIMATDISVITGENPFKNTRKLWEEKLGLREPQIMNEDMKRGKMLEPEAREIARQELNIDFEPCVFESNLYPWAAASLDGLANITNDLISYFDCILEIKCPRENRHKEMIEGFIPSYYMDQMQWQMMVTKCPECFFMSYCPSHKEQSFVIRQVKEDREYGNFLTLRGLEFHLKLCRMEPPEWTFESK